MKPETDNTNIESTITGTLRISKKGIGFIYDDKSNDTVIIEPAFLHQALHGDTVTVLKHPNFKDDETTGEVTEIVKRKKLGFIGTIEQTGKDLTLKADDGRMYATILIAESSIPNDDKKLIGQKALVEIVDWPVGQKNPIGEIVEVLGEPGTHEVEMQSIVLDKGLPIRFPDAVEKEGERVASGAPADMEQEAKKRRDFRTTPTFTIDPHDAKDFDDALSIKKLDNGNFEVGVHIADVSHFVTPGSILDKEASKRATSIYLVDRTIPMLPEALSNNICSLMPEVERLAFAAVFEMDIAGNIKNEWFGRTIIKSDKRFSYEEVQDILDARSDSPHKEFLFNLRDIARGLRQKKLDAGAVTFEDSEVKFVLDEENRPIAIKLKERLEAHMLIEDFMLLANKKVAEFAAKKHKNIPDAFVYRIHDYPDVEKMTHLKNFLEPLGYHLKIENDEIKSEDLNNLLAQAEGKTEQAIIQKAAVRSMSKAIYSVSNIGHWGLAFPHYTHFTSPIRRYPDVLVHRLLNIYLQGQTPDEKTIKYIAEQVVHSSSMEQKASEAERESIRYKQIEYMADKVGQVFDGIISGVAEWGIFVEEITTRTDGLVGLRSLHNDFYEYDQKKFALVGRRTGTTYRLGDKVKIKLMKTDLKERQVDYILV